VRPRADLPDEDFPAEPLVETARARCFIVFGDRDHDAVAACEPEPADSIAPELIPQTPISQKFAPYLPRNGRRNVWETVVL